MKLSARTYYWLDIVIRLVVGAVFVTAGALKIGDTLQFGDKIASFEMLPNSLVNYLAMGLPVFEMLSGLLLIVGWFRRPAALGIVIVSGIFLVAIVSALARGLTIDCGCFGTGTPTRARMWMDFGRDIALFAAILFVYCRRAPNARVETQSHAQSLGEPAAT